MEFLSVIAAAAVSFVLGALWYMALAEPWMRAAGIARNSDGTPMGGQSPLLFAGTFILQLIVAGMMRHVFSLSGIETIAAGLVAGAGVGAFIITPWIAMNNAYGMRPLSLTLIDGGYATLGCAVMGLVLTLF
jgi:hypothetical protein